MVYVPTKPYRAHSDELLRETECSDLMLFRTDRRTCLPFADIVVFNLRETNSNSDPFMVSLLEKAYEKGRRPSEYEDQIWIGICYEVSCADVACWKTLLHV